MASPYGYVDAPSYKAHRMSQTFSSDLSTPPAPPPKPSSQEISRQSTPGIPPRPSSYRQSQTPADRPSPPTPGTPHLPQIEAQPHVEDPGPNWLPKILEDKSKHDLEEILRSPKLLEALAYAPSTAHPSTLASNRSVQSALSANMALAQHVSSFYHQLSDQRTQTSAQLLTTHALERQWRQKQSEMDRALSEYSPSSLYQRMGAGVGEQEAVCRALEESFIDGPAHPGGGKLNERELGEWIKRYREERKTYYGRRERKERWDEGRVGGWR